MTKKFEQKIFLTDKEVVTKEYTISELKELLAPTVMINLYYATQNPKYWMWQRTDKKLTGEKWRKCQTEELYKGYEASNFGRIRKNGKILPQYEKCYEGKTAQDIKKVIEDNPGIKNIGYLQVNSHDVHRLVADAWLVKTGEGYDVHHISNDGYDNCPYNLIYLPKEAHRKSYEGSVHNGKLQEVLSFYYRYPGPRRKLI